MIIFIMSKSNLFASLIIWLTLCSLTHSVTDYWTALEKALQFYEAQRAGYLPSRTTCYRFHAFLSDKGENCEDLTGGWMDAGDFVKFNLPMSSSATLLALAGIYYKPQFVTAQLFNKLLYTLKSPLDYFVKSYINDKLIYG